MIGFDGRRGPPRPGHGKRRQDCRLPLRRRRQGHIACVQMGAIEFHGWGSRIDPLEKPDRLVFDLDPDVGLDFAKVKQAALRLRDLLADLGLVTFPLLSGGKGIHVVAPLDQSAEWPAVKDRSRSASAAPSPRPNPNCSPPISARTSAPGASSSTGCATSAGRPRSCLIRPARATVRRWRRRWRGRSWTASPPPRLTRSAMPMRCSIGQSSKALAGWGQAKQELPDA